MPDDDGTSYVGSCNDGSKHTKEHSLAFRTGCSQSVVMHTYTYIKGLALRFRGDSLHSCPQGSEGASVLVDTRRELQENTV